MIRKGNLVQVVTGVVGIECRKPAATALHAHQPIESAAHALRVAVRIMRLMHGPRDDGRVVEIGIKIIPKLKRPTTPGQGGTTYPPIAGFIQQLLRFQPVERAGRCVARVAYPRSPVSPGTQARCPKPAKRRADIGVEFPTTSSFFSARLPRPAARRRGCNPGSPAIRRR